MGASNRQTWRWQRLLAGSYAVALALLSLLPQDRLPTIPDWSDLFSPDKVAHFGAYAIFALLLSLELFPRYGGKGIGFALLGSVAYGALMEILQGLTGQGRQADYVDMVANLLGAVIGAALFWAGHKLYHFARVRARA